MQDTNLKSAPLVRILDHLRQKDRPLADLVALFLRCSASPNTAPQNVFIPQAPKGFLDFGHEPSSIVNNLETLVWPVAGGHFKSSRYLPIRALRSDTAQVWGPVDKLRIFLSSGTTSGPEGRSRSAYSQQGLDFYRAGSIAAFLGVLERCVLPFSGEFLNISPVSLIPTVDEWPDSSLAQMISWFSDVWPTAYANSLSTEDVFKTLDSAMGRNRPIILFGTAFHFVNILDQGLSFKLPVGSIIIETGGTKGRSRSVTREDLYQLLSTRFGIEESRIVSEYGMCELASQAWDFVAAGQSLPLAARYFRFPWWVTSGVMTSPSKVSASGVGALTIDDPLRIDIGQTALQTEDLASLHNDGSFKLIGRVPRAPLKGCSLKVSDIADHTSSQHGTLSREDYILLDLDEQLLAKNAILARKWFLRLLGDKESFARLQKELGDKTLAQNAIADLYSGLPKTDAEFADAARAAINDRPAAKKWLLIAPASHSVAAIHPLSAAMTLGLNLRIRLPEIAGLKSQETFLARAVELAQETGARVETLPPSFRLGQEDLLDGENILVFGDDETCAFMRRFAPGRVAAFGTAVSLSIAKAKDLENSEVLKSLVYDQLSLAQRGCLSSRALLVIGGQSDILNQNLTATCKELGIAPPTNPGIEAARAMEEVRLSQSGFHVSAGEVLVATKSSTLSTLSGDLSQGISRLEFVIPVFILPGDISEVCAIEVACQGIPIRAVSAGETSYQALLNSKKSAKILQNLLVVKAGKLGCQPFDGHHLGRPFFGVSR